MTIYPYEVSLGLLACTATLTILANVLSMRAGTAVAAASYALVATSGIVTCTFAALFGYWITAGVGAAAALVGALLTVAIANTLDTEIAAASTAEQPEQEGATA